jgi:hypothetical protein
MKKYFLLINFVAFSLALLGKNPDSIPQPKKEKEFYLGISYTANQFFRIHNNSRLRDTASYFDSPWIGHIFGVNFKLKTKSNLLFSMNLKYLNGAYFTRSIVFVDDKVVLESYRSYRSSDLSNIGFGIGCGYRFAFNKSYLEVTEDLDFNRTTLYALENRFILVTNSNVLSNGFFTSTRSKFFVNASTNILYAFNITPRFYLGSKLNFLINLNRARIEINDWERGPKNYLFYFLGGGLEFGFKLK